MQSRWSAGQRRGSGAFTRPGLPGHSLAPTPQVAYVLAGPQACHQASEGWGAAWPHMAQQAW